jgi:hypothetical protein
MSMSKLMAAGGLLLAAASAEAAVITLNFEGVAPYPNGNNVLVNEFYNGGTSSAGLSGPNLGVQFNGDVLLLCLNTVGTNCSNTSKGGLGVAGSDKGAIYFLSGNPIMNVAAGFDTGFSGVFSAPFTPGTTIKVWSDVNAGGSLLASLTLGTTTAAGCTIAGQYCPFEAFSLAFAGTAKSVQFGGTLNQQVFDDLTFGSLQPGGVPEPASWAMLIAGFGLVGAAARRRRAVAA